MALPNDHLAQIENGENWLAVFRAWRGMTFEKLSQETGISQVTLKRIEAFEVCPSDGQLRMLARALETSVADIEARLG